MEIQTIYQEAIRFAAAKHQEADQKVPGTNLPYIVHLSNVAMETIMAASHSGDFDLRFAILVALLHDTLEDTSTSPEELENTFGPKVAEAVSAMTKNDTLQKDLQMDDCLLRIKKLQPEVWAVKMADRITNLQPPPAFWTKDKIKSYLQESKKILNELHDGNKYLANRLERKIEEYSKQLNLST
jgi:guanosine-3',5'-bis(diphosphate) 3'-pyrophosphohydrolase